MDQKLKLYLCNRLAAVDFFYLNGGHGIDPLGLQGFVLQLPGH